MQRLIAHTEVFFPGLFLGLVLAMELGLWLRKRFPTASPEQQSMVESARDVLGLLLSLLLAFSPPLVLPHYDQRLDLVTSEANTIATVAQRAQLFPEPMRSRILAILPEYVDARLRFAGAEVDSPEMTAAIDRARYLQNEMWEQTVQISDRNITPITPTLEEAVGSLSDLIEERHAADEKHIPTVIWLIFLLIPVLTCVLVGYSMRSRIWIAMIILPLTIAIVLCLISELDNPQAGIVRISQESMIRVQQELKSGIGVPH